eukprot:TRINITY_DN6913_c0_g1_i1.p1 TRINITY_DN6913_c0_g1~~TRINITY_DN6913_c0_g1_i1.p1  ORF type:complete len:494 (+),score=40.23 TRINITY_DN6913_c0_g1_i1:129-1484(+)
MILQRSQFQGLMTLNSDGTSVRIMSASKCRMTGPFDCRLNGQAFSAQSHLQTPSPHSCSRSSFSCSLPSSSQKGLTLQSGNRCGGCRQALVAKFGERHPNVWNEAPELRAGSVLSQQGRRETRSSISSAAASTVPGNGPGEGAEADKADVAGSGRGSRQAGSGDATMRPFPSYYPPGFEHMEKTERFDWGIPIGIGAVLFVIWSFRYALLLEIPKLVIWFQVIAYAITSLIADLFAFTLETLQASGNEGIALTGDILGFLFSLPATVALSLILLMPARRVGVTILLVNLSLSIADVAVPPREKPLLSDALGPNQLITVLSLTGLINPLVCGALLAAQVPVNFLRWRFSWLTLVTPAVVTAQAVVESTLLRVAILIAFVGALLLRQLSARRQGKGGDEVNGEGPILSLSAGRGRKGTSGIKHPLLLRAATLAFTLVLAWRWGNALMLELVQV